MSKHRSTPPELIVNRSHKPTNESAKGFNRRDFLTGAAGCLGALSLGGSSSLFASSHDSFLSPQHSGIEHVVLVMMENRSFDHFLGWLPNADGKQSGLAYTDAAGNSHATHPLAPDYQGCGQSDPDHSYTGGRVEYDGGRCDGWLRAGANDIYSIGYYTQNDLAFLGQAAPEWTTFSRYFAAIMAETYPNRIYQHAAQTDRITNTTNISTLPTIWDRLASRGLTGRYYYSDIPILALWGAKYLPISRPASEFLVDCAAGTLPQVSYVDPEFLGETQGASNDDHPHADIRNGEVFLNRIYTAVTQSPNWHNTVLIINFDEWGGFFEHVPPPRGPIPQADRIAGNKDGRFGFRVPCLVISPWARRGAVFHSTYDHTSILRMIEWRWDLRPLTVRDAFAHNLATALDFKNRNNAASLYNVPLGPFGGACAPTAPIAVPAESSDNWEALRDLAIANGWPIF